MNFESLYPGCIHGSAQGGLFGLVGERQLHAEGLFGDVAQMAVFAKAVAAADEQRLFRQACLEIAKIQVVHSMLSR